MRKTQRPTKIKGDGIRTDDRFEHPAYGMISCSRVSGHTKLVGSDLKHQHYISLRIKTANRDRGLGRNWWHGRKVVTEILLSEHQWASFVASMNMGMGVPCTFRIRPEDDAPMMDVPELEEESLYDMTNNELKKSGRNITAKMVELVEKLKSMGDAAGSIKKTEFREVVRNLDNAVGRVSDTMPFYVKQHKEAMEENVQAAKSDVEGYVTDMITKLGIEKLADIAPQLEDHSDDEE